MLSGFDTEHVMHRSMSLPLWKNLLPEGNLSEYPRQWLEYDRASVCGVEILVRQNELTIGVDFCEHFVTVHGKISIKDYFPAQFDLQELEVLY